MSCLPERARRGALARSRSSAPLHWLGGEFLRLAKTFTLAHEFCYGVSVAERARVASFQRLL
jgi:hypothetical protein